jgi:hypothetical protein
MVVTEKATSANGGATADKVRQKCMSLSMSLLGDLVVTVGGSHTDREGSRSGEA